MNDVSGREFVCPHIHVSVHTSLPLPHRSRHPGGIPSRLAEPQGKESREDRGDWKCLKSERSSMGTTRLREEQLFPQGHPALDDTFGLPPFHLGCPGF